MKKHSVWPNEFSAPGTEHRPERHSVGIRTVVPFEGMFAHVDRLLKELRAWVKAHEIAEEGPFFLRYHVIDMQGPMDIEVGFVVSSNVAASGPVKLDVLPAGRYVHLTYSRYALRANKALIGWAYEQGLTFDRWDTKAGDAFACRYEAYLTDYRLEPLKKRWQVDLAIKLVD